MEFGAYLSYRFDGRRRDRPFFVSPRAERAGGNIMFFTGLYCFFMALSVRVLVSFVVLSGPSRWANDLFLSGTGDTSRSPQSIKDGPGLPWLDAEGIYVCRVLRGVPPRAGLGGASPPPSPSPLPLRKQFCCVCYVAVYALVRSVCLDRMLALWWVMPRWPAKRQNEAGTASFVGRK